ncbi:MAG: hypothetical protein ACRETW_04590 [Stenotrophobium sp.]
MSSVAINLPESLVTRTMAITGKRTARAAVIAALADQGNVPNAETKRALLSKDKGKTFKSADAAIAYLERL